MSALVLQVSAAGRAALVNAQNTGTLPLLVSEIGITSTAFTAAADGSDTVLPGEIKRLTTFAGDAVAADTIHVSITDDTADVYDMRGFAMYFDDGTLFALYGQADPIMQKSAQAMMLLALDAIFQTIDVANLTFGDTNFALPPATTDRSGIVELATSDETTTGTDAVRAVTPFAVKTALDTRFGAGAPSTFVKSLLTAATALAFRTALAIKGAALYDIGTGKGLDADLLDGQHGSYYRAWANLTDVPVSFPPSAHQHAWGDITGAPVYATRWAAWDEVTSKPATFPPAPHSQDWSTILNVPVQTTRWPKWTEVTAKPLTLADFNAADGAKLASAVQPNTSPAFSGIKVAVPADFWTSAPTVFLGTTGFIGSNGSFALSLRSNGYRNTSTSWTSLNQGGNTTGSGIDLMPDGTIRFLGGAPGQFDLPAYASFDSMGNLTVASLYTGTYVTAAGATLCLRPTGNGNVILRPLQSSSAADTVVDSTGAMTVKGSVTATGYDSAASSRAVKHDIAPCRYGLDEFLQIPWVEYRYNESITADDRLRFGSIVEDVDPFAPLLVIRRPGKIPTFEYDQFIPVIGRALQQYIALANARADAAEASAAALSERLAALEARV